MKESMTEWTKENEFKESFRVWQKWAYKKVSGQLFGDRIMRVGVNTLLGKEWSSKLEEVTK